MITLIGKLNDTKRYIGVAEFNVFPTIIRWSPKLGREWLDRSIDRGDKIVAISRDISGEYAKELSYLRSIDADIEFWFHMSEGETDESGR